MRVQKTTSPVIWSLQKGLFASWGMLSYGWGRCSLLSLVSPTRLLIAPRCPKAWVSLMFDSKLLSPSVCFNEVRVMTLSSLHHRALKHLNRGQTRKAQLSSPGCKLWTVALHWYPLRILLSLGKSPRHIYSPCDLGSPSLGPLLYQAGVFPTACGLNFPGYEVIGHWATGIYPCGAKFGLSRRA